MSLTSDELTALAQIDSPADVWVVGGAVRDSLSATPRSGYDLDLAAAAAEPWARAAASALNASCVRLSRVFPLWRIARGSETLTDVWQFEADLAADLRRRDFTVNAMAVPLADFAAGRIRPGLIDPHGGLDDLASHRLRLVSASALDDDPLRICRAVRFEVELGLRPDAELRAAMQDAAPSLAGVPGERIAMELERILSADRAPWALRRLEQCGALGRLFPELDDCRGVDQRPVHRRDVFWHQYDALRWLTRLTAAEPPSGRAARQLWAALEPVRSQDRIRGDLDRWRLPLRTAALLHDIGKPDTRVLGDDGRTHFYGHSELGADLAEARLRQLRFPSRVIEQVRLLIEQHLRPGQVASPGRPPTDHALHRFHAALGEAAAPLCWLFLADSLATAGARALLPRWPAYAAHVGRILSWQPRRPAAAPRLIDGRAIMDAAGIGPGPQVGAIQREIDERAALGEIETAEQARQLARELAGAAV